MNEEKTDITEEINIGNFELMRDGKGEEEDDE